MSADPTLLEQQVRAYVQEHYELGNSYIKTKHISKALDTNSSRIRPIVSDLVHEGTLTIWRDTRNAAVYQIHLENGEGE